jgi:hypothetical protein
MIARFEIGEVLLTTSIGEIERQVVLGVMARNTAAGDEVGEGVTGGTGELTCLPEGQDALRIEGNGEFAAKAGFNLWDRKSQTACHGFGDVEMKRHGAPVCCFDSTSL